ncbi:MAG: type II toxin-antitoxin system VapC family toxin [Lentisphaerota bacterium]
MIVADSNLVAYLLIPGEKSELADRIFKQDSTWVAPLLCRSELRNILTLYMKKEGMSLAQAQRTIEKAESLLRNREYAVPSDKVLEMANRHHITACDAEFVVLAKQFAVPLLTFDGPLRKACPEIAMDPEKFRSSPRCKR